MGLFDFLKRKSKEAVPQPPKEEIEDIEIPPYLKTKIHGQTATLVDMLIELNKKKHFKSPDRAIRVLFRYIEHLRTCGDEVAFNCSIRRLKAFANECFTDGHLNIDKLRRCLDCNDYSGIKAVYKDYVIDKTVKLVEMMNEFRRYDNSKGIVRDFKRATGGVRKFSSNPNNYYFGFGFLTYSKDAAEIRNRFYSDFKRYVNSFWSEFAPNGTLDNALFRDFMIERHEKAVEKYGIEAVIRMNYHHACGRAFVANYGWVGPPFYMKVDDSRKYIKSCGEFGYPFAFNNSFEFYFLKKILETDDKYVNSFIVSLSPDDVIDRDWTWVTPFEEASSYSIPKYDYSLPIYNIGTGEKLFFDSQKEKVKFIIEMKWGLDTDLKCPLPPYLAEDKLIQELEDLAENEEEREEIKREGLSWLWRDKFKSSN